MFRQKQEINNLLQQILDAAILLLAFWGAYSLRSAWSEWFNLEIKIPPFSTHLWMILIHRYPHGIRGVAGFAYGMSQLPWPTFLTLNFAAAGLWSCAVVSVGYAFGQVSEKVMSDASSGLGLVMLVVFLGLSWILSKKLERVVARS